MKNLALADWERLEVASFEKEKKIKAQVAEKRGEAPWHRAKNCSDQPEYKSKRGGYLRAAKILTKEQAGD